MPVSIEADHTVTFVAPKIGQYLLPGKINSGKVHVVSIGEKKSEILKVSRCSKIKFNPKKDKLIFAGAGTATRRIAFLTFINLSFHICFSNPMRCQRIKLAHSHYQA